MQKTKLKILSIFDGISCARVALERAGIPVEVYYASEIDRYAMQISARNYPDIVQVGSVVGLDTTQFKDIDILVGGSPCQDLSIAKKDRKGLSGERSGLFWEYVRILNEVKPKYFILENVNSMPKEAKQLITETLGVESVMINASLVSAQNRKRLFWVGKLVGDTYEKVEIPQPEDKGILLRDILEPKVDEKFYVKDKSNTIRTSGRGSGIDDKHNWDTIRVGQIGKGGQGDRIYSPKGKSVGLSALGGGRGAKTGLYAVEDKSYCVPATYYKENVKSLIKRKKKGLLITQKSAEADNASNCKNNSTLPENTIIRKLTPVECERLQSLQDNYTEGVSNTRRYQTLGNAFNCEVVTHILKFYGK